MPRTGDYFYDRYFRKDYDLPKAQEYIEPDESQEDIERQMAMYAQDPLTQPVDTNVPLRGLQQALGVTAPGAALGQIAKMMGNRGGIPGGYPTEEDSPMMASLPPMFERPIEDIAMAESNDAVQEAIAAYRENDYDTATNLLRQAQQRSPNYPRIDEYLSMVRQGKRRKHLTQRYKPLQKINDPYSSLLGPDQTVEMLERRFPGGI